MKEELQIRELEQELEKLRERNEELEAQVSGYKDSVSNLEEKLFQYKGLIYSSSALITFLRGADYIIEFANMPIRKVWGKGDNVVGKALFEVIPEVKDQGIESYLNQVFYDGVPYHAEGLPIEHRVNGSMVKSYFDFSYMPQYDSDGEIVGIGVVAQDVTNRERLNAQNQKREKEFRELIDFMPHKVSLSNSNGDPVFFNKSWLDYTGLSMEQLIEKKWWPFIHPDHLQKAKMDVSESLETGCELDMELMIKDREGDYKWHLWRAIPVLDEEDKVSSWISTSTPIERLKEIEQEKESFLKLVSHELKTPVTSIKGYVQLLQKMMHGKISETKVPVEPYLGKIEDQIERLIVLISEMLDLSRLETNELKLNREHFQLNQQVDHIVQELSDIHPDVQIEVQHEGSFMVEADRGRIGQVLINFLTNAYKYSPENKHIKVKVHQIDSKFAAVSVKDTGIGIKENDRRNIFKRFYRVESKNEYTYSGFGIGLFLSKEIIERHQGKIILESEFGRGSEFTFTLPLNN
ncbi:PAS domain S-box protein [Gramella sp. BOM4]|nr:PAS domain S-box protein [Christiangramia bathymodioli]